LQLLFSLTDPLELGFRGNRAHGYIGSCTLQKEMGDFSATPVKKGENSSQNVRRFFVFHVRRFYPSMK
jgi:hypothetical protein